MPEGQAVRPDHQEYADSASSSAASRAPGDSPSISATSSSRKEPPRTDAVDTNRRARGDRPSSRSRARVSIRLVTWALLSWTGARLACPSRTMIALSSRSPRNTSARMRGFPAAPAASSISVWSGTAPSTSPIRTTWASRSSGPRLILVHRRFRAGQTAAWPARPNGKPMARIQHSGQDASSRGMDRRARMVARSAHWNVVHGDQDRAGRGQFLQLVQRRGRAQLAGRRGHHAKPPSDCFLAGLGQQQRFPRARFAVDEQQPPLALLRVVQEAEDGLGLRLAPPHRGTPVSHGIPQPGPPSCALA